MPVVKGHSDVDGEAGVIGSASKADGVLGISEAAGKAGIAGANDQGGNGVYGRGTGNGIFGHGQDRDDAVGVVGVSDKNDGVRGWASAAGKSGVAGTHTDERGQGVWGSADRGIGVVGKSQSSIGVLGTSENNEGVRGESNNKEHGGVVAVARASGGHALFATCDREGTAIVAVAPNGNGLYSKGSRLAGLFEGDVEVTGDIRLSGADGAEDFDIAGPEAVEPGTVMVLGEEGVLYTSDHPYDKRVAGIIAGAGDYKPGILLDRQRTDGNRQPIALFGKVFCKVDAAFGSVEIGDLLTTSSTPGYAMKASDPLRAFGAVLGKALRPLNEGQGLIPVLVSLQ
ncbi:MAG: hypothetical protein M3198_06095 [Actinomycetota bacterium]|nr:hypothetical protein [Actinomycetota bacterium]